MSQKNLYFIPVDFDKQNITEELASSLFDKTAMTFASWLGVTFYLDKETVYQTLGSLSEMLPIGSTVVFDYMHSDAFNRVKVSEGSTRLQQILKNVGEPMKTGFEPSILEDDLKSLNLRVVEDLSPAVIEKRYFAGFNVLRREPNGGTST